MTVVKDYFVFFTSRPKEKAPFPAFVMQTEKGACTYTNLCEAPDVPHKQQMNGLNDADDVSIAQAGGLYTPRTIVNL
jgi:hypothetical protein